MSIPSRQSILLVEDDPFLRKAMSSKLRRCGFAVTLAEDGEEALRKVTETTHDLVLLDLILPKIQGFEVLQRLKSDPSVAGIPVIVLSNLGQESDIQRVRELGAIDFLVKANMTLESIIQRVELLFQEVAH